MEKKNFTMYRDEHKQELNPDRCINPITNSKMIVGSQELISPYSLNEISLSNTPWMQKLIKKRREVKDSRIVVSRQFDYLTNPRMIYIIEEHLNL